MIIQILTGDLLALKYLISKITEQTLTKIHLHNNNAATIN